MIQKTSKPPKVALCRKCHGTGQAPACTGNACGKAPETMVCPQCDGSGRVTVSAEITYDIRPYRNRSEHSEN